MVLNLQKRKFRNLGSRIFSKKNTGLGIETFEPKFQIHGLVLLDRVHSTRVCSCSVLVGVFGPGSGGTETGEGRARRLRTPIS